MSSNPAVRQVAPFYLAAAAAVVYTYTGNKTGFATVGFLSVCNTDTVTRDITLAVVPAGGTITTATYRVLDTLPLLTKQTLLLVSDSDDTGLGNLTLRDGDQLVMFGSAANVLATRIAMVENNAG